MTGTLLTPGAIIRLKGAPEWGRGHVQSCIGNRLTANFEHAGKVTVDLRHAAVEIIELPSM